jgi:hypothetical protein
VACTGKSFGVDTATEDIVTYAEDFLTFTNRQAKQCVTKDDEKDQYRIKVTFAMLGEFRSMSSQLTSKRCLCPLDWRI